VVFVLKKYTSESWLCELGLLWECIWYFGAIISNKQPFLYLCLNERTSTGLLSLDGIWLLCFDVQNFPFASQGLAKLENIEAANSILHTGKLGLVGLPVLLVSPLDLIRCKLIRKFVPHTLDLDGFNSFLFWSWSVVSIDWFIFMRCEFHIKRALACKWLLRFVTDIIGCFFPYWLLYFRHLSEFIADGSTSVEVVFVLKYVLRMFRRQPDYTHVNYQLLVGWSPSACFYFPSLATLE